MKQILTMHMANRVEQLQRHLAYLMRRQRRATTLDDVQQVFAIEEQCAARAQGAEAAEKIRADADRQRTEILADAYREAEQIRGKGDAAASEIYAKAFEQNAEFYSFWRSLKAYREVFQSGGSLMLLDPDSEFFRYFKDRQGN